MKRLFTESSGLEKDGAAITECRGVGIGVKQGCTKTLRECPLRVGEVADIPFHRVLKWWRGARRGGTHAERIVAEP